MLKFPSIIILYILLLLISCANNQNDNNKEKTIHVRLQSDSVVSECKSNDNIITLYNKKESDSAILLNNLGFTYNNEGNYIEAIKCHKEALRIKKMIFGENHPNCVISLNNLGYSYQGLCKYEDAKICYLEALRIIKENVGCKSLDYAVSLNNLGSLYQDLGNYFEAERNYVESLQIRKEILGENNIDYALVLNNLSSLYDTQGKYLEAIKCQSKALHIRKEILGENHYVYAISLNNLGYSYYSRGDYYNAEKNYHAALKIYENNLGMNRIDNAYIYNNLGSLYTELGNYSVAETYYLRALNIIKNKLGEFHKDYARVIDGLACLYDRTGNYSNAEKYYLQALKARKETLGDRHPDYAISLNNLACYYFNCGKYEEAEIAILEALKIRKEKIGEIHPDYAISLNNLAAIYHKLRKYKDSEMFYIQVLQLYKDIYGSTFPSYGMICNNVASLYFEMRNYEEFAKYFSEASLIYRDNYITTIDYMVENQREQYLYTIQHFFDFSNTLYAYKCYFIKPSISTFTYDNELFRKGLLLNSAGAVRRSILESGDNTLIKQWNELTEAKQVVMHLEEKEPTSNQLEIYRHLADSLEKQVTVSSAVFRESKEQWNINWKSVQKQLSKNEVAIEYFSAPLSQDSTMYCALLLRHNREYPELIPLFEEKEVTEITSTINESIDYSLLYNYNKFGATLSEKVWSKILPRVKEGETIYFSPSGLLHQLAIEYLPVDSARTMSDVYNMVRLSSTKEIVTKKSKDSYKSAVVYGGIHYDLDNDNMLAESNRYPGLKRSSLENDSINRGSAIFLPGTKDEAEKINKLLSDNKIESVIYKTKSANEESFKSLSGKHNNILHIATHGFTWTDSTARKQDYFADRMKMQLMGDNQMRGPIIDPLDRCGLLFAGANTALQGKSKELPEGVQDGILTAKEISLMDLRDAELVVLSACETAKGDITSEGVFGLQRAFKMAGAKTIIMSLWRVDDGATQLLMTEFYTNWISKKQPKREAFRNAQNTVKKQYPGPSYWAGFVMLD